MKKKSELQLAIEIAQERVKITNQKIDILGKYASTLYATSCILQRQFDLIRNVPSNQQVIIEKTKKVSLNWENQVNDIEKRHADELKANVGGGAAGAGIGVGVAALGPTAAMGVATTFGVASTGTAISALSGAAATNAALAWLGGGTLAAGGGGMVGGTMFISLFGPIGWIIAGVALLGSGFLFFKNRTNKKELENIFYLICKRDIKKYELAIAEINERIKKMEQETNMLADAILKVTTFGIDYSKMTEKQQYELGSYVNLMESSTQLLVNPILGLQPCYTEDDFKRYASSHTGASYDLNIETHKRLILSMCNLLYDIDTTEHNRKLLSKSFRRNKDYIKRMEVIKEDVSEELFETVNDALSYQKRIKSK